MEITKATIICENTEDISREEWLKIRKNGIGGSEIGGLVNLSKYNTPLSIWQDKMSGEISSFSSIPAEIGLILEDFVMGKTQELIREELFPEAVITKSKTMYKSKEWEHAYANPDGEIYIPSKGYGLYEGKTASEYLKDDWDEDSVPPAYLAQVQWYMGVLGYEWGYFGYLIGNRKIDYTYVEFDQEFFDILMAKAKCFWEDSIEGGEIPDVSEFWEADNEAINKVYPYDDGTEITVSDDYLIDIVNKRQAIKSAIKEQETAYRKLDSEIKLATGTCEVVYVGGMKIFNRRGTEESPQGETRVDSKRLKAKYPEVWEDVKKFNKKPYYRIIELKH